MRSSKPINCTKCARKGATSCWLGFDAGTENTEDAEEEKLSEFNYCSSCIGSRLETTTLLPVCVERYADLEAFINYHLRDLERRATVFLVHCLDCAKHIERNYCESKLIDIALIEIQ